MNENEMPGNRLHVTSLIGKVDLGLGTYLFAGVILLDTGKKILSRHCKFRVVPATPAPAFKITITKDTRVFEGERNLHRVPQITLLPGTKILIEKLELCGWNHGNYVAGRFTLDGEPYALVMSEVVLPEEKGLHLHVVK